MSIRVGGECRIAPLGAAAAHVAAGTATRVRRVAGASAGPAAKLIPGVTADPTGRDPAAPDDPPEEGGVTRVRGRAGLTRAPPRS